ncbi:MAG: YcfL family protein [bacterium]
MKHQRILPVVLVVCLAFVFSCYASTSKVGNRELFAAPGGNHAFNQYVLINNQELSRHLQIVDIKGRMVNDLMQAQIQVMNKFDRDYNFEYQFQWFDNKGFEIGSIKEHWTPVLIYGQEVKTLVGMAPNPQAVKFRINIRAAHPIR